MTTLFSELETAALLHCSRVAAQDLVDSGLFSNGPVSDDELEQIIMETFNDFAQEATKNPAYLKEVVTDYKKYLADQYINYALAKSGRALA